MEGAMRRVMRRMKRAGRALPTLLGALALMSPGVAEADRVSELETVVKELTGEVQSLRKDLADEREARREQEMESGLRLDSVEQAGMQNQGAVEGLRSLFDEESRVKLGGYGSVRFENGTSNDPSTFTFRRFVLTTDAQLTRSALGLFRDRVRTLQRTGAGKGCIQDPGAGRLGAVSRRAWVSSRRSRAPTDPRSPSSRPGRSTRFSTTSWRSRRARFSCQSGGSTRTTTTISTRFRGGRSWSAARPSSPSNAAWTELGAGITGSFTFLDNQKLSYWAYVMNGVQLDAVIEEEVLFRERTPPGGTGPVTRRDVLELEVELRNAGGTFNMDGNNDKAYRSARRLQPDC